MRITELDLIGFHVGDDGRAYRWLGARPERYRGRSGTRFSVWAPQANSVSVVGDFNGWKRWRHRLRPVGSSGVWQGFVGGVQSGDLYKLAIEDGEGNWREKADPFGRFHESAPNTASIVHDERYCWSDQEWMAGRSARHTLEAPMSVYEVHLGSWRRPTGDLPTYRDIAGRLADYVDEMGFTHVELMPVLEHPFYGSWGYQVTGFFAATSRYGPPEDLKYLVDVLHQRGIGVILDWVPAHFPEDPHGLAAFDGSHLFEHADERQGRHPDWNTLIFNYGRGEVRSFLLSSAGYWLDIFHVDGLRVDAVASMLYLDYSRPAGEWIPNPFGGRENLEAESFIKILNEFVYREFEGAFTVAEESTSWPGVSSPTYNGGLGFGWKWDMGWMHDVLQYLSKDPVYRHHHHDQITFRSMYARSENFLLALSHDEVVHGKGSLMQRMPGDEWQKRANNRLLFGMQFAQPGKKLLFMGMEFGQIREWSHERELDWDLLGHDGHKGLQRLVRDLNWVMRSAPALHEGDHRDDGVQWTLMDAGADGVFGFVRRALSGAPVLVVANCTPQVREAYPVPVPMDGLWKELINTDDVVYGGSGITTGLPQCALDGYLSMRLPPLGVTMWHPLLEAE